MAKLKMYPGVAAQAGLDTGVNVKTDPSTLTAQTLINVETAATGAKDESRRELVTDENEASEERELTAHSTGTTAAGCFSRVKNGNGKLVGQLIGNCAQIKIGSANVNAVFLKFLTSLRREGGNLLAAMWEWAGEPVVHHD